MGHLSDAAPGALGDYNPGRPKASPLYLLAFSCKCRYCGWWAEPEKATVAAGIIGIMGQSLRAGDFTNFRAS